LYSYYVHLDLYSANPLHSTWSRPDAFAKLIRAAGKAAANNLSSHDEGDDDPMTARSDSGYYDDFEEEDGNAGGIS
jgi:hypothetical protein